MQVAILARSSREMSQTDRIVWKHILSQVPVSVRRINFYTRKTHKTSGNRIALACVYLNEAATPIVASGTGRHGWVPPTHRTSLTWKARRYVCVRARACVRDVFSIYDNNIWHRLIMIIIKIIILYFIQIRHTDDLPSTGTRLEVAITRLFHFKQFVWSHVH